MAALTGRLSFLEKSNRPRFFPNYAVRVVLILLLSLFSASASMLPWNSLNFAESGFFPWMLRQAELTRSVFPWVRHQREFLQVFQAGLSTQHQDRRQKLGELQDSNEVSEKYSESKDTSSSPLSSFWDLSDDGPALSPVKRSRGDQEDLHRNDFRAPTAMVNQHAILQVNVSIEAVFEWLVEGDDHPTVTRGNECHVNERNNGGHGVFVDAVEWLLELDELATNSLTSKPKSLLRLERAISPQWKPHYIAGDLGSKTTLPSIPLQGQFSVDILLSLHPTEMSMRFKSGKQEEKIDPSPLVVQREFIVSLKIRRHIATVSGNCNTTSPSCSSSTRTSTRTVARRLVVVPEEIHAGMIGIKEKELNHKRNPFVSVLLVTTAPSHAVQLSCSGEEGGDYADGSADKMASFCSWLRLMALLTIANWYLRRRGDDDPRSLRSSHRYQTESSDHHNDLDEDYDSEISVEHGAQNRRNHHSVVSSGNGEHETKKCDKHRREKERHRSQTFVHQEAQCHYRRIGSSRHVSRHDNMKVVDELVKRKRFRRRTTSPHDRNDSGRNDTERHDEEILGTVRVNPPDDWNFFGDVSFAPSFHDHRKLESHLLAEDQALALANNGPGNESQSKDKVMIDSPPQLHRRVADPQFLEELGVQRIPTFHLDFPKYIEKINRGGATTMNKTLPSLTPTWDSLPYYESHQTHTTVEGTTHQQAQLHIKDNELFPQECPRPNFASFGGSRWGHRQAGTVKGADAGYNSVENSPKTEQKRKVFLKYFSLDQTRCGSPMQSIVEPRRQDAHVESCRGPSNSFQSVQAGNDKSNETQTDITHASSPSNCFGAVRDFNMFQSNVVYQPRCRSSMEGVLEQRGQGFSWDCDHGSGCLQPNRRDESESKVIQLVASSSIESDQENSEIDSVDNSVAGRTRSDAPMLTMIEPRVLNANGDNGVVSSDCVQPDEGNEGGLRYGQPTLCTGCNSSQQTRNESNLAMIKNGVIEQSREYSALESKRRASPGDCGHGSSDGLQPNGEDEDESSDQKSSELDNSLTGPTHSVAPMQIMIEPRRQKAHGDCSGNSSDPFQSDETNEAGGGESHRGPADEAEPRVTRPAFGDAGSPSMDHVTESREREKMNKINTSGNSASKEEPSANLVHEVSVNRDGEFSDSDGQLSVYVAKKKTPQEVMHSVGAIPSPKTKIAAHGHHEAPDSAPKWATPDTTENQGAEVDLFSAKKSTDPKHDYTPIGSSTVQDQNIVVGDPNVVEAFGVANANHGELLKAVPLPEATNCEDSQRLEFGASSASRYKYTSEACARNLFLRNGRRSVVARNKCPPNASEDVETSACPKKTRTDTPPGTRGNAADNKDNLSCDLTASNMLFVDPEFEPSGNGEESTASCETMDTEKAFQKIASESGRTSLDDNCPSASQVQEIAQTHQQLVFDSKCSPSPVAELLEDESSSVEIILDATNMNDKEEKAMPQAPITMEQTSTFRQGYSNQPDDSGIISSMVESSSKSGLSRSSPGSPGHPNRRTIEVAATTTDDKNDQNEALTAETPKSPSSLEKTAIVVSEPFDQHNSPDSTSKIRCNQPDSDDASPRSKGNPKEEIAMVAVSPIDTGDEQGVKIVVEALLNLPVSTEELAVFQMGPLDKHDVSSCTSKIGTRGSSKPGAAGSSPESKSNSNKDIGPVAACRNNDGDKQDNETVVEDLPESPPPIQESAIIQLENFDEHPDSGSASQTSTPWRRNKPEVDGSSLGSKRKSRGEVEPAADNGEEKDNEARVHELEESPTSLEESSIAQLRRPDRQDAFSCRSKIITVDGSRRNGVTISSPRSKRNPEDEVGPVTAPIQSGDEQGEGALIEQLKESSASKKVTDVTQQDCLALQNESGSSSTASKVESTGKSGSSGSFPGSKDSRDQRDSGETSHTQPCCISFADAAGQLSGSWLETGPDESSGAAVATDLQESGRSLPDSDVYVKKVCQNISQTVIDVPPSRENTQTELTGAGISLSEYGEEIRRKSGDKVFDVLDLKPGSRATSEVIFLKSRHPVSSSGSDGRLPTESNIFLDKNPPSKLSENLDNLGERRIDSESSYVSTQAATSDCCSLSNPLRRETPVARRAKDPFDFPDEGDDFAGDGEVIVIDEAQLLKRDSGRSATKKRRSRALPSKDSGRLFQSRKRQLKCVKHQGDIVGEGSSMCAHDTFFAHEAKTALQPDVASSLSPATLANELQTPVWSYSAKQHPQQETEESSNQQKTKNPIKTEGVKLSTKTTRNSQSEVSPMAPTIQKVYALRPRKIGKNLATKITDSRKRPRSKRDTKDATHAPCTIVLRKRRKTA